MLARGRDLALNEKSPLRVHPPFSTNVWSRRQQKQSSARLSKKIRKKHSKLNSSAVILSPGCIFKSQGGLKYADAQYIPQNHQTMCEWGLQTDNDVKKIRIIYSDIYKALKNISAQI